MRQKSPADREMAGLFIEDTSPKKGVVSVEHESLGDHAKYCADVFLTIY